MGDTRSSSKSVGTWFHRRLNINALDPEGSPEFSYIDLSYSKSIMINTMSMNSTGGLLRIPTPFNKTPKGHMASSSTNGSSSLPNGPKPGL